MNRNIKETINSVTKCFTMFCHQLGQTIASVLRMTVLSSIRIAFRSKRYIEFKNSSSCCVLGNGPSLKDDFENGKILIENNDIFCVNMFCASPLFTVIRPRFYFLVDVAFFYPSNDLHRSQVEALIEAFNRVDWKMYLITSSSSLSGSKLLNSITNPNVELLKLNSTAVDGFGFFRHFAYSHGLGMPRCQTVVNFALCTAINLGYKNVYLYGADHTWTRDLYVDENNTVCYGDRHVYNKNLTVIKKEGTFAHQLIQFATMFNSHYLIEDYSSSKKTKIWNCSSDSFLDAYERLTV